MTRSGNNVGIRLDRISKRFDNVCAVDNLDLVIEPGEFVSILGPSGCGKTTLLRMLAGLEQPTDGQISIGDSVVNDQPPAQRDIAMVFQTYALYPHMTVAGNIEYPLKKRRVPKSERNERVRIVAATLELEHLLDRKPRELSGGQQQRVALGRALVRDPAVFLLDEPLSNLDAKLRAHMRAELIQLHRRIGRTMVYVTHDQLEAMTMSDRIAIMQDGSIQQFASPAEVYARPVNAFVAGFIGMPPMNLVDGELHMNNGSALFRSNGWSLALDQTDMPDEIQSRQVKVGFRPEDVLLDDDGALARVVVVEPAGHEVIVVFDLHGHHVVGRFGPDIRLRQDDNVKLIPRAGCLHLFDVASGRRINADPAGGANQQ